MFRWRKGTTDHDGDGRMGGSLPDEAEERIARLEREVRHLLELAKRNGWTL